MNRLTVNNGNNKVISKEDPTYRSLAELLDIATQCTNAMTPEEKEEEVEPPPVDKPLPPMPIPRQEDIVEYSDEPAAKRQEGGYRSLCCVMPTPIYTPEFDAICAEKAKEIAAVSEENMAAHAKWREKNATVLKRNATKKEANACKKTNKAHIMVSIPRM